MNLNLIFCSPASEYAYNILSFLRNFSLNMLRVVMLIKKRVMEVRFFLFLNMFSPRVSNVTNIVNYNTINGSSHLEVFFESDNPGKKANALKKNLHRSSFFRILEQLFVTFEKHEETAHHPREALKKKKKNRRELHCH